MVLIIRYPNRYPFWTLNELILKIKITSVVRQDGVVEGPAIYYWRLYLKRARWLIFASVTSCMHLLIDWFSLNCFIIIIFTSFSFSIPWPLEIQAWSCILFLLHPVRPDLFYTSLPVLPVSKANNENNTMQYLYIWNKSFYSSNILDRRIWSSFLFLEIWVELSSKNL